MKSPERGTGAGPAGIDPPPGEGTAEALTRESLGTEGRLLFLTYTCQPEGDVAFD